MKRVSVNRELPARGSPAQPPTLGVRHNRKPAPINGKLIAAETRLEKLRDKEIGSSQSALQKALMSNSSQRSDVHKCGIPGPLESPALNCSRSPGPSFNED